MLSSDVRGVFPGHGMEAQVFLLSVRAQPGFEAGSVSVNFSLRIQPLIRAGLAGWGQGGSAGVRAGLGGVPEASILCADVCCGQKGFWGLMPQRIFE